jgi:hypothetical protein
VPKANHIVFTTIHSPIVLFELQKNLERNGLADLSVCWVVGDNKTPAACEKICREINQSGLETYFLDIESQEKWGKSFPELYCRIPYDNESRRNIGFLHALEAGCERLISIDDDNYPTNDDFIGYHMRTGASCRTQLIEEASRFHNICEYLEIEPRRKIYPRGYPFALRDRQNDPVALPPPCEAIIGVTLGLWLNDPDVDATTWINGKVKSKAFHGSEQLVLNQNTWTPVNTQNTSIIRELIPAYLCVPMGYKVPGGKIERYGDIWGGYFLQAILRGTPYYVGFGRPLVEHRRNPHNYIDDLRFEYWGMILTDWLLKELHDNFKTANSNVIDRVGELAEFLAESSMNSLPSWCPKTVKNFLAETAATVSIWAETCRRLM